MAMMKNMLALVFVAAMATPGFAEDYTQRQVNCRNGQLITDDEHGVSLGNGSLLIFNMNCTRAGKQKKLAGGWVTGKYECSQEGEPLEGPFIFDFLITEEALKVRIDGEIETYQRCKR